MCTNKPVVVVHISPFIGEVGAVPWANLKEDAPASHAVRFKYVDPDTATPPKAEAPLTSTP